MTRRISHSSIFGLNTLCRVMRERKATRRRPPGYVKRVHKGEVDEIPEFKWVSADKGNFLDSVCGAKFAFLRFLRGLEDEDFFVIVVLLVVFFLQRQIKPLPESIHKSNGQLHNTIKRANKQKQIDWGEKTYFELYLGGEEDEHHSKQMPGEEDEFNVIRRSVERAIPCSKLR